MQQLGFWRGSHQQRPTQCCRSGFERSPDWLSVAAGCCRSRAIAFPAPDPSGGSGTVVMQEGIIPGELYPAGRRGCCLCAKREASLCSRLSWGWSAVAAGSTQEPPQKKTRGPH